MKTFETTLGLDTQGGYCTPITFSIDEPVAPAKSIKVNLHSTRLGTDRILTFDNNRQAVEFIELMNDSVYFEARIVR